MGSWNLSQKFEIFRACTITDYPRCTKPDEKGGEKAVLTAVKVVFSIGKLDATQPLKIIYVT